MMTGRPAGLVISWASLLALALLGTACSRPAPAVLGCTRDDQCGEGLACVSATCLPRAASSDMFTWEIEVAPRADSMAGLTELTSVDVAPVLDLVAVPKAPVEVSFSPDAPTAGLSKAHIVLTVPSTIAGRPDLTFETDLPAMTDPAAPAFTLPVPSGVLGRAGTLQLLPTPPDSRTHAPASFVVTVAPTLKLPLSAKSVTVRGRLVSALGDPRQDFVARAFQNGALVSNADVTTVDGEFTLVVPAGLVSAPGGATISVDLAPPADSTMDPWIGAKPFTLTAATDLGDLKLPTFSKPDYFRFVAQGPGNAGTPVAGAIVRARTILAEDATTVTDFQRDGVTDSKGWASLALLPGSTAALRNYEVAVIPPPDSYYGIACIAKFPLSAGATADLPANLPPVVLPARAVVTGTVTSHDGVPAAGVVILATQLHAEPAVSCPKSSGSPPATTTTDARGSYRLPLDAGTYRLDLDPPAGGALPRLTETGITVPAPPASGDSVQVTHDVALPAGALVEGTTRDTKGQAVPLASVRIYEVACTSPATCTGAQRVAPLLKAQTRSDAAGHFRVVVAAH